jgi:hypothetical protein
MTGSLATPRRRSPHWRQSFVEERTLLGSDIGTHRAAVRVLSWCRCADSTCNAVNNYWELRPSTLSNSGGAVASGRPAQTW